jgi:hypothetical protein
VRLCVQLKLIMGGSCVSAHQQHSFEVLYRSQFLVLYLLLVSLTCFFFTLSPLSFVTVYCFRSFRSLYSALEYSLCCL